VKPSLAKLCNPLPDDGVRTDPKRYNSPALDTLYLETFGSWLAPPISPLARVTRQSTHVARHTTRWVGLNSIGPHLLFASPIMQSGRRCMLLREAPPTRGQVGTLVANTSPGLSEVHPPFHTPSWTAETSTSFSLAGLEPPRRGLEPPRRGLEPPRSLWPR